MLDHQPESPQTEEKPINIDVFAEALKKIDKTRQTQDIPEEKRSASSTEKSFNSELKLNIVYLYLVMGILVASCSLVTLVSIATGETIASSLSNPVTYISRENIYAANPIENQLYLNHYDLERKIEVQEHFDLSKLISPDEEVQTSTQLFGDKAYLVISTGDSGYGKLSTFNSKNNELKDTGLENVNLMGVNTVGQELLLRQLITESDNLSSTPQEKFFVYSPENDEVIFDFGNEKVTLLGGSWCLRILFPLQKTWETFI